MKIMKLIIIVYLIILSSCNNEVRNNNETETTDTLLKKTITFPSNLLFLENNKFKNINVVKQKINNKKKIISIVDGNCRKCIVNQLNQTDSLFNNILNSNPLIFILNVNKKDSAYFMNNLYPEINAKEIFLWDNNYNFERENQLFTKDIYLRTFMVNDTNKIIHYGNPLFEPDLLKEYKRLINK